MPFGTKLQLVKRKEAMEQGRITIQCSWPGCNSSISIYRSQSLWGIGRIHRSGGTPKNVYCIQCKERVARVTGKHLRMNGFGRVFATLSEERSSRTGRTESYRAYIFILHNESCASCQSELSFSEYPKAWQIDHIVPVASGGKSSVDNLQVLCTDCHRLKTSSEIQSTRLYCGVPNSKRQWMTHHQKDEVIIKQNAEIARLQAVIAGYVNSEELAG